jgi:hypothetical protein
MAPPHDIATGNAVVFYIQNGNVVVPMPFTVNGCCPQPDRIRVVLFDVQNICIGTMTQQRLTYGLGCFVFTAPLRILLLQTQPCTLPYYTGLLVEYQVWSDDFGEWTALPRLPLLHMNAFPALDLAIPAPMPQVIPTVSGLCKPVRVVPVLKPTAVRPLAAPLYAIASTIVDATATMVPACSLPCETEHNIEAKDNIQADNNIKTKDNIETVDNSETEHNREAEDNLEMVDHTKTQDSIVTVVNSETMDNTTNIRTDNIETGDDTTVATTDAFPMVDPIPVPTHIRTLGSVVAEELVWVGPMCIKLPSMVLYENRQRRLTVPFLSCANNFKLDKTLIRLYACDHSGNRLFQFRAGTVSFKSSAEDGRKLIAMSKRRDKAMRHRVAEFNVLNAITKTWIALPRVQMVASSTVRSRKSS